MTCGRPACEASFEGHIDWVNDVLLFRDRLVSCSSDRTVKIWQTGEEGEGEAAGRVGGGRSSTALRALAQASSKADSSRAWRAGRRVSQSLRCTLAPCCCAARCLHTVQHHCDYVTCLAASEAAGRLVSAGLRSEVITYDMTVRLKRIVCETQRV